MGCCSDGSLFEKNADKRNIKFVCSPSGPTLQVLNGANTLSKVDLCNWSTQYSQYSQSSIYLEAGAIDRELIYGSLGTQITFLMLKIDYIKKGAENQSPYMISSFSGANEIPNIIYKYETNLTEQRYIDSIMILTGTDNHKIPAIYLSNPNLYYDATITVLYATKTITFEEPTASTTGTVYVDIAPNEYFNFPNNINSLNFRLNTSINQYSYLIIQDLVVEIGSYTDMTTTYIVFDNNMVGNGKLIWTSSDVGLTKLFILGGKYYAITWQGFGSLLFNLQILDTNEQHFLVDEYNNFIVDEIGNYLSFE